MHAYMHICNQVAYGIEIASEEEKSSDILRCHIPGDWPRVSAPPNVSVGFFILNLQAEEKGLSSGYLFYTRVPLPPPPHTHSRQTERETCIDGTFAGSSMPTFCCFCGNMMRR